MENIFKILTINPGSTSTKIAVYDNEKQILGGVHNSEVPNNVDGWEKYINGESDSFYNSQITPFLIVLLKFFSGNIPQGTHLPQATLLPF